MRFFNIKWNNQINWSMIKQEMQGINDMYAGAMLIRMNERADLGEWIISRLHILLCEIWLINIPSLTMQKIMYRLFYIKNMIWILNRIFFLYLFYLVIEQCLIRWLTKIRYFQPALSGTKEPITFKNISLFSKYFIEAVIFFNNYF